MNESSWGGSPFPVLTPAFPTSPNQNWDLVTGHFSPDGTKPGLKFLRLIALQLFIDCEETPDGSFGQKCLFFRFLHFLQMSLMSDCDFRFSRRVFCSWRSSQIQSFSRRKCMIYFFFLISAAWHYVGTGLGNNRFHRLLGIQLCWSLVQIVHMPQEKK